MTKVWVYERTPAPQGQWRYTRVDMRTASGDLMVEQVPARGDYTQWGRVVDVGWALATAELRDGVGHIVTLIVDTTIAGPFINEAPLSPEDGGAE